MEEWGRSANPPILKRSCLGDIMHCPGNKGVDVCRAIEKQLASVGMNCFDVVVATGYGGGDMSAIKVVHDYFENISPGYVRRKMRPTYLLDYM